MGKIIIELRFPCGYYYKNEVSGFGLEGSCDNRLPLCPIHNKECKGMEKKKRGKTNE